MLTSLYIKNVAIIGEIEIEFGSGFNVLTGETGAGKSIIIDSINMLTGGRASRGLVRAGESRALVRGVFDCDSQHIRAALESYGVESDEGGTVILQRELTSEGKSACKINGRPVILNALRYVGGMLISIHGQQDNQTLLQNARHAGYLDCYGGCGELLERYKHLYARVKELQNQIDSYGMDEREKAYRLDMLAYQIKEIEAAALLPNEDTLLAQRRDALQSGEKIMVALNAAYGMTYDGDSNAYALLSSAARRLSDIVRYDEKLGEICDKLESCAAEAEDAAFQIKDYIDETQFSEGELDKIEERLDIIYRLKKKYGGSVDAILRHYQEAVQELERIQNNEEVIARLEQKRSECMDEQRIAAQKLTDCRRGAAQRLSDSITNALQGLDMQRAIFSVQLTPRETGANGAENVEFMISANAGEPLKPLSKIASGGELSRIMLAIKSILMDDNDADTLIFDEIDAGVSGRAALKIADKLADIARTKQVLCITHLAQIAASAGNHFLIEKMMQQDSTNVTVTHVTGQARAQEVARIIGGERVTQITLAGANEILCDAAQRNQK